MGPCLDTNSFTKLIRSANPPSALVKNFLVRILRSMSHLSSQYGWRALSASFLGCPVWAVLSLSLQPPVLPQLDCTSLMVSVKYEILICELASDALHLRHSDRATGCVSNRLRSGPVSFGSVLLSNCLCCCGLDWFHLYCLHSPIIERKCSSSH